MILDAFHQLVDCETMYVTYVELVPGDMILIGHWANCDERFIEIELRFVIPISSPILTHHFDEPHVRIVALSTQSGLITDWFCAGASIVLLATPDRRRWKIPSAKNDI